MPSIKSSLLAVAIAVAGLFVVGRESLAQTANFIFDDQNGPADAGTYPAGASFNLSINLSFAPGGNVANLEGFSYWLEQQSPLAPFYFSITNRDLTGSQFTSQQANLTYPQNMTPSNASDLGALLPGSTGIGAGNYFVANVTISISAAAAPGTYILEN
ncbi:MAG TPA: hypothetical protein VGM62_10590, partial [Chthoniobacterales bacterium]